MFSKEIVVTIQIQFQVCLQIGANELKQVKINVKYQKNCNFCYICLCGVTLMACESWKVIK
jgi:hypothetical protein